MEGTEPLFNDDGMGGMIPDGIESDNWDYFGIRNTTPLESDGDDFDFLLDNFKLEIFGSNAATPGCDFDGSGTCDDMDINMLTAEAAAGTNDPDFDLTLDGTVDQADLSRWLGDAATANGFAEPYRAGDANLDGEFDSSDLTAVFQSAKYETGDDAGWTEGDAATSPFARGS